MRMRIAKCLIYVVLLTSTGISQFTIRGVESVGSTVSNMENSIAFYTEILSFEKIDDKEVFGEEYDALTGLFGVRMRIVRMRSGDYGIVCLYDS